MLRGLRGPLVLRGLREWRGRLENKASKVPRDLKALQGMMGRMDRQVPKARLELPARLDLPARWALQVFRAQLDLPEHQVKTAKMGQMEPWDPLVLRVLRGPLEA